VGKQLLFIEFFHVLTFVSLAGLGLFFSILFSIENPKAKRIRVIGTLCGAVCGLIVVIFSSIDQKAADRFVPLTPAQKFEKRLLESQAFQEQIKGKSSKEIIEVTVSLMGQGVPLLDQRTLMARAQVQYAVLQLMTPAQCAAFARRTVTSINGPSLIFSLSHDEMDVWFSSSGDAIELALSSPDAGTPPSLDKVKSAMQSMTQKMERAKTLAFYRGFSPDAADDKDTCKSLNQIFRWILELDSEEDLRHLKEDERRILALSLLAGIQ
jgi:hypothetical protein